MSSLALVATGDGWWVATDGSVTNQSGAQLTAVSMDGLVWREQRVLADARRFGGFTPSAYGGALPVAMVDSGGQFYDSLSRRP